MFIAIFIYGKMGWWLVKSINALNAVPVIKNNDSVFPDNNEEVEIFKDQEGQCFQQVIEANL